MKKLFILVLLLFAHSFSLIAQPFGKEFFQENLLKKVYPLDSDAEAIILYEKGNVVVTTRSNHYVQRYTVHRIIKILKTSGQKWANVKDDYHFTSKDECYSSPINAATYNMDGNSMTITKMDQDAAYEKKTDINYKELGFVLPAVRAGSIIDYEYSITKPLGYTLPMWEFQGPLARLSSEFEIVSTPTLQYNSISRVSTEFKSYTKISKAENDDAQAYTVGGIIADGNYKCMWRRKNCPAVREEPYISDIENFRECLELQVAGNYGITLVSTWKQLDNLFRNDDNFGKLLRKDNNSLNAVVDSLTGQLNSAKEKALSIFNYVRCNFECNNFSSRIASQSLNRVFENRQGSVTEINLLLTAMMQKAGLNASPVILSKTGKRKVVDIYPVIDRFNYTVCVVYTDDDRYLLDATNKYNRFGVLPVYCYNGYARVIDKEGAELMLTSNDITDKHYTRVAVSNITDSSIRFNVTERIGVLQASNFRTKANKDSGYLRHFIDDQMAGIPGNVNVISASADNLKDPEKDLDVKYTVETKKELTTDGIYISTDLLKFFNENPFKSRKRELPIEFHSKMEYVYSMDIQLPPGTTADEIPAPSIDTLGDNYMRFYHFITYDTVANKLYANSVFAVTTTAFTANSYEFIKSFFEKMIKEENSIFVIKKKP